MPDGGRSQPNIEANDQAHNQAHVSVSVMCWSYLVPSFDVLPNHNSHSNPQTIHHAYMMYALLCNIIHFRTHMQANVTVPVCDKLIMSFDISHARCLTSPLTPTLIIDILPLLIWFCTDQVTHTVMSNSPYSASDPPYLFFYYLLLSTTNTSISPIWRQLSLSLATLLLATHLLYST